MVFISYAQHGEDVVLWRALGGRDNVRYVDVGAFDPTEDSVTQALYERGWRGVNVEAQADRIRAFEEARPDDINLAIAVGAEDGTATLAVPGNPGWASILDLESASADVVAQDHVRVPMRSLATLLPELGFEHLDVLKVDVEGAEPDVVRGLLAGDVRPTVCVLEGVSPAFGRKAGEEAVALLVEAGYTHCMFDGLNHYLTTDTTLVEPLSLPASPVDEFVHVRTVRLRQEIAALRGAGTTRTSGDDAAGDGEGGILLDPAALERASGPVAVSALYRSILGREPDAAGLAAWERGLADGLALRDVATKLLESAEGRELPAHHREEVRRLLQRWSALRSFAELGTKRGRRRSYTPGRVSAEIFVESLYAAGLGRAPSAEELASGVAALADGATRRAIVAEFARRPDVRRHLRRRRRRRLGAAPWRGRRRHDIADLRSGIALREARRAWRLAADYAGLGESDSV